MRLLAATTLTQGLHPGDFIHCAPGELVMTPPFACTVKHPCPRPPDEPPDPEGCRCRRAFTGIGDHATTTTAEIIESGIDLGRYVTEVCNAFRFFGKDADFALPLAYQLSAFAEEHPLGTVARYRVGEILVVGDGSFDLPEVRWMLRRPERPSDVTRRRARALANRLATCDVTPQTPHRPVPARRGGRR